MRERKKKDCFFVERILAKQQAASLASNIAMSSLAVDGCHV